MDEQLDQLIHEIEPLVPENIHINEGDYDYFLIPLNKKDPEWEVRKLADDYVVEYTVYFERGRWFCTCPAGMRWVNCKHKDWISAIDPVYRKLRRK